MSDIVSWIFEQSWGIALGVIISLITLFIVEFLPIGEGVRFRAVFYRRKMSKWLFNTPIRISYTVKTQNLEEKRISVPDFVGGVKEKLQKSEFRFVGERGNASIYNCIIGRTEAELTLVPSYCPQEDEGGEALFVDYLQCSFELKESRYRQFDGHMLDLVQLFRKLETSLEDIVGKWTGESLVCDIKRLYEFTGVLKDLKMSSLMGKIGGRYTIELFENRLVVYGLLEAELTSMVKDIITFYY